MKSENGKIEIMKITDRAVCLRFASKIVYFSVIADQNAVIYMNAIIGQGIKQ